jgi:hypothetical protein
MKFLPASWRRRAAPARQLSRSSGAADRPIFVIGVHRGKTTLVQRALNCSREVVLWGEHGGILKHYRAAFERFGAVPTQKRDLRSLPTQQYGTTWIAMANPMSQDEYLDVLRDHVKTVFGALPDMRWGFKEITYHEVEDAEWLIKLFPECRIVYLVRDPVGIFMSQYFVSWNTSQRAMGLEAFAHEFAAKHTDVLAKFNRAAARFENARMFDVDALAPSSQAFEHMIEFLDIPMASFDQAALESAFSTKVGSSFGGTYGKGIESSPGEIEAAEQAIRAALASVAAGAADPE